MVKVNFDGEMNFAKGYFFIRPDGIVQLDDEIPNEMRILFWKKWVQIRPRILQMQRMFIVTSKCPTIPDTDNDPNYHQYQDLVNDGIIELKPL